MREIEETRSRQVLDTQPAGEPPKLTRRDVNERSESSTTVIETARPELRGPDGIRVEGSLVQVDCSDSLTLHVRVGNATVLFHTTKPADVEFMSYVPTVKDTFACGPLKPEVPVAIVYKRSSDTQYIGEPLRVEFIERK